MRLKEVLHNPDDAYQGVYECETCHGVSIDKAFKSTEEATSSERVSAMGHCYLCDTHAPLSNRYQMALDTLAWAAEYGSHLYDGKEIGFPSFNHVYVTAGDIKVVVAHFRYEGRECTAAPHEFSFEAFDEFGTEPVESTHRGMGRLIAEELVSRVIADLAAQGKEAE